MSAVGPSRGQFGAVHPFCLLQANGVVIEMLAVHYTVIYGLSTLVLPQRKLHILDGTHHPSTTAVIKRFAMAVCGGSLNAPST